VIDGIDGRAHHVRLADIDATSDTSPGGIVELRRFVDATGRPRVALAVRPHQALCLRQLGRRNVICVIVIGVRRKRWRFNARGRACGEVAPETCDHFRVVVLFGVGVVVPFHR
jgi:hypothetical protein